MPARTRSRPWPVTPPRTTTTAKTTVDGYTIRFGMIRWLASMRARASSTVRNAAIIAATYGRSNLAAAPANRPAVASSVSGYRTEIRAPQDRHRPRRSSHETTGMLSRDPITAPQRGQADRGSTMERFWGTRSTTTVRKEPNRRPNAANTPTRTGSIGW